jgi:hypothetical protein
MDVSLISAAASSIGMAKDLGRALVGLRDFNEVAPAIAELNQKLLDAQESLFKLQAQVMSLQQEHFETTEKLRKATEAITERKRYSLFALSDGIFVYRMNVTPVDGNVGDPIATEPTHYLCQRCFDQGTKVVLMKNETSRLISHFCPNCKVSYLEKTNPNPPANQPQRTSWARDW